MFPANVSACTYAATLQGAAAEAADAGFLTVGAVAGNVNAVAVTTWTVGGDLANRTFHLAVHC